MRLMLHKITAKYHTLYYNFLAKYAPAKLKAWLISKLTGPYKGALTSKVIDKIPHLENTELAEETVKQFYETAKDLAKSGEFDKLIDLSYLNKMQSIDICRCYGYHAQKRWKLQFFYMPKGTEHPAHAHHNLDSFLVVLKGKIWMKEFKREASGEDGKIKVVMVNERTAGLHEGMITTEFGNNIHHFGAVEDSICLNFNLRGYNKKTFYEDNKGYGRRYLGMDDALSDGMEVTYKYK